MHQHPAALSRPSSSTTAVFMSRNARSASQLSHCLSVNMGDIMEMNAMRFIIKSNPINVFETFCSFVFVYVLDQCSHCFYSGRVMFKTFLLYDSIMTPDLTRIRTINCRQVLSCRRRRRRGWEWIERVRSCVCSDVPSSRIRSFFWQQSSLKPVCLLLHEGQLNQQLSP